MSDQPDSINANRRHFLTRAALTAAALPLAAGASASHAATVTQHPGQRDLEPFFGRHQGGIATAMQRNTYFMAFDITSTERSELVTLLKAWTNAAATLTQQSAGMDARANPDQAPMDNGAALGLSPARLTITFGFGPTQRWRPLGAGLWRRYAGTRGGDA